VSSSAAVGTEAARVVVVGVGAMDSGTVGATDVVVASGVTMTALVVVSGALTVSAVVPGSVETGAEADEATEDGGT
jgi:hypothetical protein